MKGAPLPHVKFETLGEALESAARSRAGIIFVDAAEREARLSFAELWDRARRIAGALSSLGVLPGDRVALVLPTAPSFMDAFFGTLLLGATPVPLYPPLRLGRLAEYHARTARMLEACGAKLLVTDGRIRRLLGECVERANLPLGWQTVEALSKLEEGRLVRGTAPNDLALIQFSSGTTVDCKPVALTHANLLANVAAIDSYIPLDGRAGVSWLPLYHDMGLIGCLLEALYRPGDLVLIPPELFLAKPALWLRAISRHRADISPAPNFAYGLCTKRIADEELAGVDLSSWSMALNGAEPVTPAVLRAFTDRFARWGFRPAALTPAYGLAEASLAVTLSEVKRPFSTARIDPERLAREGRVVEGNREVVSVGVPVPGVEVEVRDEDGSPVEEGRVGRIHVRGPSVTSSHVAAPSQSAAALVEGWLDTGDLGFVAGGELFVCGRAKELVILRGANHAPQEFEECLEGMKGVRAGCVVAFGHVPEGASGEELGLLVETTPDAAPGLEERIRGAVALRTGIRPSVIALLAPGTLPRTSSGKLRRGEAARLFLAGELTAPERVSPVSLAVAVVRSELGFFRARTRARGPQAR